MITRAFTSILIAAGSCIVLSNAATAAESKAAPLPGTPGSAVPPSATPSTSLPSTAPAAVPPPNPIVSPKTTSPIGTPMTPAISPAQLGLPDEEELRVHAVRKGASGTREEREVRQRLRPSREKAPRVEQPSARSSTIDQPQQARIDSTPSTGDRSTAAQSNGASTAPLDSFFQLSPQVQSVLREGKVSVNTPVTAPALSPPRRTVSGETKDDGLHLGRAMYHILDNIGVPMPYKNKSDLDPSIIVPPPSFSVEARKLEKVNINHSPAAAETVPEFPKAFQPAPKIPASELEGVDLPAPGDAPKEKQ